MLNCPGIPTDETPASSTVGISIYLPGCEVIAARPRRYIYVLTLTTHAALMETTGFELDSDSIFLSYFKSNTNTDMDVTLDSNVSTLLLY